MSPLAVLLVLSAVMNLDDQDGGKSPIATDRPDFTETAEPVPMRRLQIEGGYTFTQNGAINSQAFGETLLRIATGRRAEVRLGFNSFTVQRSPAGSVRGFEDFSLGTKMKLLDASKNHGLTIPDVAVIVAASVPSGSSAFRESYCQPEAKLCFAWELSERLSLSSNVNVSRLSEDGTHFIQISGSLSFGYALNRKSGVFCEMYGFRPAEQRGPDAAYLDGGITYLIHNDLQLDARAGIRMHQRLREHFVGFGASQRW